MSAENFIPQTIDEVPPAEKRRYAISTRVAAAAMGLGAFGGIIYTAYEALTGSFDYSHALMSGITALSAITVLGIKPPVGDQRL